MAAALKSVAVPDHSKLKRVVLLGRRVRAIRLVVELDFPSPHLLTRHTATVSEDQNLDMLCGYAPEELRYIVGGDLSPRMVEFVTSHGHQPISFEEAEQWLKNLSLTSPR